MKEGAYDFYEFPVNKRLLLTIIEKAGPVYRENKIGT